MDIKGLLTSEDRAVSPVIGVILMVAITVILAAVIGTFVLGLGENVQSTNPSASFSFDYQAGGGNGFAGDEDSVTITHESGDVVQNPRVTVVIDGTAQGSLAGSVSDFPSSISAGDSFTYDENTAGTNDLAAGSEIRVVWESESGENTATLGTSTAPN